MNLDQKAALLSINLNKKRFKTLKAQIWFRDTTMSRKLASVLLIAVLAFGIVLGFGANSIVSASTAVSGRIESSATWTKAGSPYTFSGNVLVSKGITLTIEAGATVNFNDYFMMVNGTLQAKGTNADKIQFNGGKIIFTDASSKWNEQSGSGCLIDYANLETTQIEFTGGSPKLSHSSFRYIEVKGDSTVFSDNLVTETINVNEGSAKVTGNTINGIMGIGVGNPIISYNTITDGIYASDWSSYPQITHNTVTGGIHIPNGASAVLIENNKVWGVSGIFAHNATVSYNDFHDQVSVSCSETYVFIKFLQNTITSSDIGINLTPNPPFGRIYALIVGNTIDAKNTGVYISGSYCGPLSSTSGRADIVDNRIFNCKTAGILVAGAESFRDYSTYYNHVNITNNKMYNNHYAVQSSGISIVEGNIILNNYFGISTSHEANITNNIVSGNTYGIFGNRIEGNLITNNKFGVGGDLINNNTIIHNSVGVTGFSKLAYNNIYDNTLNVNFTSAYDGDATYNWWGTTDANTISQSISDSEEDFMVGKVNFTPTLTALNPSAPSPDTPIPSVDSTVPTATDQPTPSVPEYSPQTLLTIAVLMVTILAVAMVARKKAK